MQARLAGYRTLTMSSREMLLEFPPNPVAKAVADGKLPMPSDPYRHAVYVSAIDRVKQQQEKKQNADGSGGTAAAIPSSSPSPNLQATTVAVSQRRMDRREAHGLVDELSLQAPDARMQRILSLPVAEQRDLTQGVPFEKRQALLAGLSPTQRETVLALNNPTAVINSRSAVIKIIACGLQRSST